MVQKRTCSKSLALIRRGGEMNLKFSQLSPSLSITSGDVIDAVSVQWTSSIDNSPSSVTRKVKLFHY